MVTFSGVELWFGVARETRPQRPVYVTKEIVYLLYFLKREFSEFSLSLRQWVICLYVLMKGVV